MLYPVVPDASEDKVPMFPVTLTAAYFVIVSSRSC